MEGSKARRSNATTPQEASISVLQKMRQLGYEEPDRGRCGGELVDDGAPIKKGRFEEGSDGNIRRSASQGSVNR